MNTQVSRTNAETALAATIAERVRRAPGGDGARALRAAAAERFAAKGLPGRRVEEWKYTDLRTLLKDVAPPPATPTGQPAGVAVPTTWLGESDALTVLIVDGIVAARPQGLPSGVGIVRLAERVETDPDALAIAVPEIIDAGAGSLIALNTALAGDGAVIDVAAGVQLERPIHIVHVTTGSVAVRHAIRMGAKAKATIVETHVSAGGAVRQENAVAAITLADGAELAHVVHVTTATGSVHLANTIVMLGAASSYRPVHMTIADGLVRQQLAVTFTGEGASFDLSAAALGRGDGHGDTTLVVDHAVPGCTSRELFKSVLDGRARAVFQGKVIVQPVAQKTDGKQMAQALMLSPDAEFDSKPELEIYADDVICGHGSTVAEIDADMLFYLRSRGIPADAARTMLIESFIGEAIDKAGDETLRAALTAVARGWLSGH